MVLLPFLVRLVRRGRLLEVVVCLFEVQERHVVSTFQSACFAIVFLILGTEGGVSYSDTLQVTMNLRSLVFFISSSSPSSGRGLRLTPPL